MKIAHLLHNPTAGDEEHSKNELKALIEEHGLKCAYFSTKKKGWEEIQPDTDIIIVAGGDGTVRKVAQELLSRKLIDKKIPIGVLPLGTANNIAKTLGITGDSAQIIKSWEDKQVKKFDVGRIEGIPDIEFMLEGLGYGIFPRLIKEMRKADKELSDDPEIRIKTALKKLYDIVLTLEPFYCLVETDGVNYYGKFLLVEVMNTSSIGPNLQLAANADPGDGSLDVVLIRESQREELAAYIQNKINDIETPSVFTSIRATRITLQTEELLLHVDDELVKLEKSANVQVEIQDGRLEFLIPV